MKAVSLLTLSLALLCAGSAFSATNVKVKTPLGTVVGIQQGDVDVFKGLPYAEPPVGELRWRETVPVKSWESDGARIADAFSNICPQARFGDPESWEEGMSEDCLYLNIWRPHEAETKAKLPVMVWIHGGAFVFGSGSVAESVGNSFAESGVILVTINYRLGRLGHFAFPALTKMHSNESKGSYAYMDQVEALRWLNANIESFGGDQNNITIFGESAGGVSVHSLLSIADAEGLFHKAIVQSGGGRDGVLTARPLSESDADPHYPESAEQIGINFAEFAGIKGTDEKTLAQLMALPFEAIVAGGVESDPETGKPIYSGPIKDGKLVQRTAETAYKQNTFNKVPLMIGSNTAEVPAGFVNASSKQALWSTFGEFALDAANAYDYEGDRELDEVLTYVNTDKVWAEPVRFTARIFAEHDLPVYVYRFGYVPEALTNSLRYGAPHASEIPYVFNNLDARRGNLLITEADKKVSGMLNAYWVNFAKSGSPNGEALPEWSRFSNKSPLLLKVNKDGRTSSLPDSTTERLDVIEKTVE
ncbi:carboxylesterase family protein [Alteromonas sp. NFXS44]|uniref:carboxylesterase/lipase family protein n=1 Tax=Alteromonas sp. NFXS44 TaxID=2818435 RepID=UPI0032DEF085